MKRDRQWRLLAPVLLFVLTPGLPAAQESTEPTLVFGSLLDPSSNRGTEELLGAIQHEIEELVGRDYDVRFPDDKQYLSDWTTAGMRRALDELFDDPEVQMLLVVGPVSTAALRGYGELPKPVFAPLGVDGQALGLPSEGDSSGVRNLNYLNNSGASFRDLRRLVELGEFEVIHILTDPLIYEVLEDLYDRNQAAVAPLGVTTELVPVVDSADEVLNALPQDAHAAYFTPLLRMSTSQKKRLIEGLNRRRIATMSLLGREEVELGVLAGLRAPTDYARMARRIAINVQRALFGEDPGSFSITFERTDRLVINMATAREIGLYPSWSVLADAVLLNEEIPTPISLSLSETVLEALAANPRILAARRRVSSDAAAVREVRSGYLPQLDGSLDASSVNSERAVFRAERSASAGLTLGQVIWSDSLAASIRIQRDVLRGTEQRLKQVQLDLAAEAARAFLDVLRFVNLERIALENLRRVEANLDLARNRVQVGYASSAEVYRWEVERANLKNSVVFAGRTLDAARVRVNQLRYRPQEEAFETEPPDIEGDPYLVVGNEELAPFYDNPWSFRIFRAFMVEDGLTNSPELRRFDAAIRAQQRQFGVAKRSFWSPTIGFLGEIDYNLARDSEQSPAGFAFPDDEWSLGVSVNLPLYAGGGRWAATDRNREELLSLRRERDEVAQRIELRIRTAMFAIAASWTNIDLSREAAVAAKKNLELVTDSYAKGVVSIQDLLDAQNSEATSQLNAANAVFDFLQDLVEVQRSAGRLEWFRSEEKRDEWVKRIREYFDKVRKTGEDPGGFE